MFGDREKFLDKFKTCARTRPFAEQRLSNVLLIKEHSKPLFNSNGILTLKNLYFYHCCCEVFKILKFRCPIAFHSMYKFSSRQQKNLFLITPRPSDSFVYRTSSMWNTVRQKLLIPDSSFPVSTFKLKLKKYIFERQTIGCRENWIETNFVI